MIQPHSEDYSEPYGPHIGQWGLCYWCHMLLHCRYRAPAVFHNYERMLIDGERFVNDRGNWSAVLRYLSGRLSPPRELHGQALTDPFGALFAQGAAAVTKRTGDKSTASTTPTMAVT